MKKKKIKFENIVFSDASKTYLLPFPIDRYWPALNITCNFFLISFSFGSKGSGNFFFNSEVKSFFFVVVKGFFPPPPLLVVRPLKKTFIFLCLSSLRTPLLKTFRYSQDNYRLSNDVLDSPNPWHATMNYISFW